MWAFSFRDEVKTRYVRFTRNGGMDEFVPEGRAYTDETLTKTVPYFNWLGPVSKEDILKLTNAENILFLGRMRAYTRRIMPWD